MGEAKERKRLHPESYGNPNAPGHRDYVAPETKETVKETTPDDYKRRNPTALLAMLFGLAAHGDAMVRRGRR
jgi:hypothetical protein